MAKLKTKTRKALPSTKFGIPGKRKHLDHPESRLFAKGKLSGADAAMIRSKANRMLEA